MHLLNFVCKGCSWFGLQYVKYCREYWKKGVPHPQPDPIVNEGYDVIIGWMSTKRGTFKSSDHLLDH